MTKRHDAPQPALPGWLVVAIVLLAAGYAAVDSYLRSRHILEVGERYGVTVDAPAVDNHSPTGFADGRRSIVLPAGAADARHWVMQTQEMIARGEWRIRRVDYDNAPLGRDVHWASPFHWWLAALAWVDHAISGRPIGMAVERAALTAGPVMLVVVFLGLLPLLARKFSPTAAALAAVAMVCAFPFYTDFAAGRADHHGLANTSALLMVLLMAASAAPQANSSPGARAARRWFAASGAAGAIGLWISAATLLPIIASVGGAVLLAGWLGRRAADRIAWMADPMVFRYWGWAGGVVSFVAYLIEYFPSHLGWRLEVNHPLYALAWVGAGEVLRVATVVFAGRGRMIGRRNRMMAAVGAGAVLIAPAVILFAPETFVVRDPFVWQMHVRYISEFQDVFRALGTSKIGWLELLGPLLLLAAPIVLPSRTDRPVEARAALVLVTLPAAAAWLLGAGQIRWMSLAIALSLPVVAVSCQWWEAGVARSRRARWALPAAMALLFVPGAFSAVRRTVRATDFTAEEIRSLAERDVAHWLRARGGSGPVVVAGAASPTTSLIFHGSLKGLGTLYWENAEGLKNASALFAAASPEAAEALARRLGVTHIVLFSWDAFDVVQAKLYRGLPESTPIPADLFIANLLAAPVPPPWLRAIPFKLPDHPELAGQQVRIWEVVPPQTPEKSAAHAVSYYLELGHPEIAARLAPLLGDDLTGATMRAAIAVRQRDAAAFAAAFAQVSTRLAGANQMSLEERIALAVVLAVAERNDAAREQLRTALQKTDAASVRHLTSGTLSDLLVLADALGLEWPDAAVKRLAEQMLPPSRRNTR
jgi:hypothetical protein